MQTITQHAITDAMSYQNTPALNCRIRYPQFAATCSPEAARSMNEYYISQTKEKAGYCRTDLYLQAVEAIIYGRAGNYPFFPYEFDSGYKTTYNADCIISLYSDQYVFTGGAHGSTLRTSQTWDSETGKQLQLSGFYRHNPGFIQDIQSWIGYEIGERLKSDPGVCFDDYQELLRSTFHPENYYLTPKGIILYYQQYDIAPYSSGIPEFLLPF